MVAIVSLICLPSLTDGTTKKIHVLMRTLILPHELDEILDVGRAHVDHHLLLMLAELFAAHGLRVAFIGIDGFD